MSNNDAIKAPSQLKKTSYSKASFACKQLKNKANRESVSGSASGKQQSTNSAKNSLLYNSPLVSGAQARPFTTTVKPRTVPQKKFLLSDRKAENRSKGRKSDLKNALLVNKSREHKMLDKKSKIELASSNAKISCKNITKIDCEKKNATLRKENNLKIECDDALNFELNTSTPLSSLALSLKSSRSALNELNGSTLPILGQNPLEKAQSQENLNRHTRKTFSIKSKSLNLFKITEAIDKENENISHSSLPNLDESTLVDAVFDLESFKKSSLINFSQKLSHKKSSATQTSATLLSCTDYSHVSKQNERLNYFKNSLKQTLEKHQRLLDDYLGKNESSSILLANNRPENAREENVGTSLPTLYDKYGERLIKIFSKSIGNSAISFFL